MNFISTNEIFKIWLAGFFDGEGSICLNNRGDITRGLRVSIGQKNWVIIDHLRSRYGGTVAEIKKSGVFTLNLTSKKNMEAFLKEITPYLIVKKTEAEIALCICQLIPEQGKPQTEKEKLMRLMLEQRLEKAAEERLNFYKESENE